MLLAQTGRAYLAGQRLLRGDVATVAMAERELVGYAWVTFRERWISEIRATIVPQDRDVLGYDKRITPKWRGKGMQYALSVATLQNLAAGGYGRLLNWVDALNTRSLRNQRRVGRRKIADIISIPPLRILRVRICSPNDRIRIEKRTAI
jgi:GNAT superfamily N-acetyltransferase